MLYQKPKQILIGDNDLKDKREEVEVECVLYYQNDKQIEDVNDIKCPISAKNKNGDLEKQYYNEK